MKIIGKPWKLLKMMGTYGNPMDIYGWLQNENHQLREVVLPLLAFYHPFGGGGAGFREHPQHAD